MHLLSVRRIFLTALAFAALNSYAGIGHLRVNHLENELRKVKERINQIA